MRPPAVLSAILIAFTLPAAPALAQGEPTALSRTLAVSRTPDATSAPPLHLRPRMTTTLEFGFPVREPRLTGPGADTVTLQQLEPHVLNLYPARALGPWQATTLTLTAEDGARYPFTLVMDGSVDVKVRVQRGEGPPISDLEEAATRFLLHQAPKHMRQVTFTRLNEFGTVDGITVRVDGTVPLDSLALLVLSVDAERPVVPDETQLIGPPGALRVLGVRPPDQEKSFSLLVQRPEGHADGTLYTLTLTEKQDARRFVITNVEPWPVEPSPQGDVLGLQEHPEADPGRSRHGKVPGTQRRQPR